MRKQMHKQKKIYETLNLFLLVFKTTTLTIGGGLIIISELKKILVKKRKIISKDDFNKILATSNVIPGVTAINFVFLVGKKFGGFPCALLLVVAGILPSIIAIILVFLYLNLVQDNIHVEKFLEGAKISSIIIMSTVVLKFSKKMLNNSLIKWIICFIVIFAILKLKIKISYILIIFFLIYIFKYITIKKILSKEKKDIG
ncbi:chromate transporter [Borrelia sp. CA_690]|uniref:Chromate transporter n=1 Tax=Borrelia maritima TaxID=2761123 RepID=A0A5J6WBY8_9SPIR|nr:MULTISPECIES: chromate transporter [Borrelia]QFI14571.1 chromate transporter [Borrelia maritima]WKC84426.1 chromate transporter [Borrelia sp. CA_690]